MKIAASLIAVLTLVAAGFSKPPLSSTLFFDFGVEEAVGESIPIHADAVYDPKVGYGFEYSERLTTVTEAGSSALLSEGPLVFSAKVPEGNYDIIIELIGSATAAPVTIKAESRRLVLRNLQPPSGTIRRYRFTTNVRTPQLSNGGQVTLNAREIGVWHWDDRLQIEINSGHVLISAIEVRPNPTAPTIYIAGDSTVTDQPKEPWTGWGQMLPSFLVPDIAVANHAESGSAFSTFKSQHRLDKILETLNSGDYLLMQFGHNDMKERGEGIGPWQSYTDFIHEFVAAARQKGAQPILITPPKRRRFDEAGRQYGTHLDYPKAIRQAAADLDAPLIDLNLMTGVLYGALGPEDSKKAFVHYPAGPVLVFGRREDMVVLGMRPVYGPPGLRLAKLVPVLSKAINQRTARKVAIHDDFKGIVL